jgi:hypothetical protein
MRPALVTASTPRWQVERTCGYQESPPDFAASAPCDPIGRRAYHCHGDLVGLIVVNANTETSQDTQIWLIANYAQIVGSAEGGLQICQRYASHR